MICSRCKNDSLKEEHDFCFKCGLDLRTNGETSSPTLSQDKIKTAPTDLTQAVQDSDVFISDKKDASLDEGEGQRKRKGEESEEKPAKKKSLGTEEAASALQNLTLVKEAEEKQNTGPDKDAAMPLASGSTGSDQSHHKGNIPEKPEIGNTSESLTPLKASDSSGIGEDKMDVDPLLIKEDDDQGSRKSKEYNTTTASNQSASEGHQNEDDDGTDVSDENESDIEGDEHGKVVLELRGKRCGGCRRVNDADRPFAFEVVSEDGSPLIVLAASTEKETADWIFRLCQVAAEMFDTEEDMYCTAVKCIPCCLILTKGKIVACIPDPTQEDNFQLLSDCSVESVTRLFVDNDVRNYCILEFERNEMAGAESSWFVWFKTEYELAKFERALIEAWRELFQVDLQFLVLGEGSMRQTARLQAKSIEDLYKSQIT